MSSVKRLSDTLHDELARWRTKFDELELRGHLGKREAADKVDALRKDFDEAYADARSKLADLKRDATHEWSAVVLSLESGWNELRKTYEEASSSDEDTSSREA